MSLQESLLLFFSAALGGAVNSVAGGGTLLTFPALLSVGMPAIQANATSTVALWPGQLSSLFGYRKEIGRSRSIIAYLAVPSFLGGGAGALLLLHTPKTTFDIIVPYLILTATLLFLAQEPVTRRLRARAESGKATEKSDTERTPSAPPPGEAIRAEPRAWAGVMGFQFLVAVYGGYFGAGIGILMLTALGFMGFTNIHRMNGLKNINGLCINAVAALLFIANRFVDWPTAALMATGAIFGGYGGAGIARRIGQKNVRRVIIGIGFALTLYLFLRHR